MEPKAKNDIKSNKLYEYRKFYDKVFFPKGIDNLINLWNRSQLYGRVNKDLETIILNTSKLKNVPDTTEKLFINEVVALAYKEFNDEYRKADFIKIIPKSNLNPLKVKKTIVEPNKQYLQHIDSILNVIIDNNQNIFKNQTNSLEEFINNLCSFIVFVKPILTKTKFINSNLTSVASTGLSLEFSTLEHGNDIPKASKFINDQNFTFFINTAEKYSFYIDKNAPWRIIFNVNTAYASSKFNQLGYTSLEDFFDKSYTKTYLQDYSIIREVIKQKYASLYEAKPKTQIYSYSHEQQKVELDTLYKKQATDLEELVWIRLWYFFRVCEEHTVLTQNQFNNNLLKINSLYFLDKEKALKWIEKETNSFLDGGRNPSYNQYVAVEKSSLVGTSSFIFKV